MGAPATRKLNHRFPAGVHWASSCYHGFTMATCTEEIGRTETGQKCKKGHRTSTPFKQTLPCCLTSPLAVYANTFSSSSNRESRQVFKKRISAEGLIPILGNFPKLLLRKHVPVSLFSFTPSLSWISHFCIRFFVLVLAPLKLCTGL